MGGIYIVYVQPVYNPVQLLYKAGFIYKRYIVGAGPEHEFPMVRHAACAVQIHELAVAQGVVDLKSYLRAGGKNQNILDVSRGNSLLPCAAAVQDILDYG